MLSCCYFHYSRSSICFVLSLSSFYLLTVMQCINCALSNEKFCSSAFTHSTAYSGMLLEILLIILEHQKIEKHEIFIVLKMLQRNFSIIEHFSFEVRKRNRDNGISFFLYFHRKAQFTSFTHLRDHLCVTF